MKSVLAERLKNMKVFKKIFAIALCGILIASAFAGCSKSGEADKITDKTMLIATPTRLSLSFTKARTASLQALILICLRKSMITLKTIQKITNS